VNVSLLSTSIAERFATQKLADAERIDDNHDYDDDEVKKNILIDLEFIVECKLSDINS